MFPKLESDIQQAKTEIQQLQAKLELMKTKLELLKAIGNGDLAAVKLCVEAGTIDINALEKNDSDRGRSPLMLASGQR